jgi:hypothetical protein
MHVLADVSWRKGRYRGGSKSFTLGIYYNWNKYYLTVYSPKDPDQGEGMGPLEEWPGLPYMISAMMGVGSIGLLLQQTELTKASNWAAPARNGIAVRQGRCDTDLLS